MKRLLQTLLAAIGVLGVAVVAAVVYVTTFLDPEDFKPRLIEVVREHSGMELTLNGPLAWSFYPRLGVSVERVESHLPEQALDAPPFLAFDKAEVSLAFAPLLRGEIAIEGLTLDGMQLRLVRDEQGQGNWEPLLQRLDERREGAESALAPASAGPNLEGSNLAVALNIANVQVRNGAVRFRDLAAESEWLLDDVSLSGTNVNPERAFPLKTSFSLTSYGTLDWRELERTPGLASTISLEGRVRLALAERRYVLEGLKLSTATRLGGVEGRQQADLTGQQLVLDLSRQRMQLQEGRLEGSVKHPLLGESALPLVLAFAMEADLAESTAQLRDLLLTGPDDLRLSGNLNLAGLNGEPSYSGQVSLAPLSLRPWLARFDQLPSMAGPQALSDVALTSPIRGDLNQAELSGLTLVLDDSTFTGRLGMGFDGRALMLALQGDSLNLDNYLPPPDAAEQSAARRGFFGIRQAHADDAAPLVPVEWLSELALDGGLDPVKQRAHVLAGNGRHHSNLALAAALKLCFQLFQTFRADRLHLGENQYLRFLRQARAIGFQLAAHDIIGRDGVFTARIDQMDQRGATLDMAKETVANTGAFVGAFDQAWNIREHKALALAGVDDAQIGMQRGEGIGCDLRVGPAAGRQEGRLARIGQTHQPRVRDEFQAQPQPALLALLAGLGVARGLLARCLEMGIALAAASAARQQHLHALFGHVGEHFLVVLVEDLRAHRHFQDDILAIGAGAVCARAINAALSLEMLLVAVVDERVEPVHGLCPYIAALAAIPAIGTAKLDIFLPPERNTSRPAITRRDEDFDLIEKFHGMCAL